MRGYNLIMHPIIVILITKSVPLTGYPTYALWHTPGKHNAINTTIENAVAHIHNT